MFKSHLKFAWRNLLKDRRFSFLNLMGLSTGLACTFFIYLWVYDELNVDQFHKNNDRLFEVMINTKTADAISTSNATGGNVSETLKKQMPEVENAVVTTPSNWFQKFNVSYNNNTFSAEGNFVSQDYFKLFSYQLLQGNKANVLADKNGIVISQRLAKKLFNTTDNVTGKQLVWKWLSFSKPCVVTGIFENMPVNSTTRFDFVLPFNAWNEIVVPSNDQAPVATGPFNTFLLLKQHVDVEQFNNKLQSIMKTVFSDTTSVLFLKPYASRYLYGKYENGVQQGGRIEYVRLFSLVAFFILLIACINFMNLSTAKSSKRAKEMGIKKVLGAERKALILQFLGESMILSFISTCIALFIVWLLLPQFNLITGKEISLQFNTHLLTGVTAITIVCGLFAGSYPALYLSRFNAAKTLKGQSLGSAGELWARKGLIIFQFTVSLIFIIAVLVVYNQVKLVQNTRPGYDKNNILYFELEGTAFKNRELFLGQLRNIPGVVNASSIQNNIVLPAFIPGPGVNWDGKNMDDKIRFYQMPVNYDLIETLGIEMKAGRSFSRSYSTDSDAVVLNEAAVKAMELANPIGKTINVYGKDKQVIGVTKNFYFNSLHETIKPFIFKLEPENTMLAMVKLNRQHQEAAIKRINTLHKSFNPGYAFDYKFLDNDYQQQYSSDKLVETLSKYFAGISIVISCLGLFGLAAFTAERRKKEISIRKVLGATVANVVMMLSKDFLKLIILAVLIAFPIAWIIMNNWLNGFAYRIHIGVNLFLFAGMSVIVITCLTIGWLAIKSARANPVKSLKAD